MPHAQSRGCNDSQLESAPMLSTTRPPGARRRSREEEVSAHARELPCPPTTALPPWASSCGPLLPLPEAQDLPPDACLTHSPRPPDVPAQAPSMCARRAALSSTTDEPARAGRGLHV